MTTPRVLQRICPEWTAEEVNRVAMMLADGKSASEIGTALDRSRNAVIGIIHRRKELREMKERNRSRGHSRVGTTYKTRSDKGTTRGQRSISVKSSRKQGGILGGAPSKAIREARKQNLHAGNILPKREARALDPAFFEPVVPISAVAFDAACPKVSLANLNMRQCKFPLGDPRDDGFGFCGHPRLPGYPYCRNHCERAFQNFQCSEAAAA